MDSQTAIENLSLEAITEVRIGEPTMNIIVQDVLTHPVAVIGEQAAFRDVVLLLRKHHVSARSKRSTSRSTTAWWSSTAGSPAAAKRWH